MALHQRAIGMARSGGNQESEDSPNDSVSNDSTPSQADSPNGAELLSDPRTFYSRSDWTVRVHGEWGNCVAFCRSPKCAGRHTGRDESSLFPFMLLLNAGGIA